MTKWLFKYRFVQLQVRSVLWVKLVKTEGNCQNPSLEMDVEGYMVSNIVFPNTPLTVWKTVRILLLNDYSMNVG